MAIFSTFKKACEALKGEASLEYVHHIVLSDYSTGSREEFWVRDAGQDREEFNRNLSAFLAERIKFGSLIEYRRVF